MVIGLGAVGEAPAPVFATHATAADSTAAVRLGAIAAALALSSPCPSFSCCCLDLFDEELAADTGPGGGRGVPKGGVDYKGNMQDQTHRQKHFLL